MLPESSAPERVACFALVVALLACGGAQAMDGRPFVSLKEIRERGVVMQRWENSCAAATLATVLTYAFGDPVSEAHVAAGMLQKAMPSKVRDQGGFSLLDMKRFAEDRGYSGRAYKHLSMNDLRAFRAPIVPINTHGYNHYVVFNGMSEEEVFLADPAFGHRKMPLNKFEKMWMDGMAFVVTKESHDKKTP